MRSIAELAVLQRRQQRKKAVLRALFGAVLATGVMLAVAMGVRILVSLAPAQRALLAGAFVLFGGIALQMIERQLTRCPACSARMELGDERISVAWIVTPHHFSSLRCGACGYPEKDMPPFVRSSGTAGS